MPFAHLLRHDEPPPIAFLTLLRSFDLPDDINIPPPSPICNLVLSSVAYAFARDRSLLFRRPDSRPSLRLDPNARPPENVRLTRRAASVLGLRLPTTNRACLAAAQHLKATRDVRT